MAYEGRKYGYSRVSRQDQCLDRQLDGLADLCDELRVEKVSSASKSRPVFEKLMNELQYGDTLIVWDLDRAFRSTIDAVTHAEALRRRGINFRIVMLNVDTATDDGMLIYTFMAAVAEHERKRLIRRTREGIEAARKRGTRLGRPPKLSPRQIRDMRRKLDRNEVCIEELARSHRVHPITISRALDRLTLS